MAACQQWTDTPPPFLFWVSTVQPPLNCLLFSCPQAPFSTRDERKRKEKAKRSSLKKPQKKPFCWWASRASYSTESSPVVMPEMLSVTLDVVWEFACPRTVQKHRACSISVYSWKRATMVLDTAWKETFLSFLLKTGLPLQVRAKDRGDSAHCYHALVLFLYIFSSPRLISLSIPPST